MYFESHISSVEDFLRRFRWEDAYVCWGGMDSEGYCFSYFQYDIPVLVRRNRENHISS